MQIETKKAAAYLLNDNFEWLLRCVVAWLLGWLLTFFLPLLLLDDCAASSLAALDF